MIVCPVCEHAQEAGAECALCGKRLVPDDAPGEATAIEPLPPGLLEPTLRPAAYAPDDEVEALEPTRHAAVAAVAEPGVEIEPTRTAPVDVGDPEPLPDLERTEQAGLPGDARTAVPAVATCRYCRTQALPGERICGRCGMRLPIVAVLTPGASPAAPPERHCSCGMVVRGWSSCPACGGRIASA